MDDGLTDAIRQAVKRWALQPDRSLPLLIEAHVRAWLNDREETE